MAVDEDALPCLNAVGDKPHRLRDPTQVVCRSVDQEQAKDVQVHPTLPSSQQFSLRHRTASIPAGRASALTKFPRCEQLLLKDATVLGLGTAPSPGDASLQGSDRLPFDS